MISNVNLPISVLLTVITIVAFICKTKQGDAQNKVDVVVGNQFPYIVSLQIRRIATNPWKHKCHGALIHKRWILIPAFCGLALKLSSVFKRGLGAKLNRDNIINSTGNSIVHIKNVYFSGDPMSGNFPDAALVQLSYPVVHSKIGPIKLSKKTYQYGTKLHLASWGKDIPKKFDGIDPEVGLQLKKKVVTIKYYNDCKQPDPERGRDLPSSHYFCGDAGWCTNDYGAPLVIKNSNPKKDILVAYYGHGSLMKECWRSPHLYSNVTAHLPWIKWIFKQNGDTLSE